MIDLRTLFRSLNLEPLESLEKINIGFSNDVYDCNGEFIVKLGKSKEAFTYLKKELFFLNLFKESLPVPEVVFSSLSSEYAPFGLVMTRKRPGQNLYACWHLLSQDERRSLLKELCQMLKLINTYPVDSYLECFSIDKEMQWEDFICSKIQGWQDKIRKKEALSEDLQQQVTHFVSRNRKVLSSAKPCLTYWDLHFDNILVEGGKITALFDFERTDYFSMDYTLDIVRRMVHYPKKYCAEQFEVYIKKEDYANLMEWYEEFYPELFHFPDLQTRLDLYSVEHALSDIFYFPESESVKGILTRYINNV